MIPACCAHAFRLLWILHCVWFAGARLEMNGKEHFQEARTILWESSMHLRSEKLMGRPVLQHLEFRVCAALTSCWPLFLQPLCLRPCTLRKSPQPSATNVRSPLRFYNYSDMCSARSQVSAVGIGGGFIERVHTGLSAVTCCLHACDRQFICAPYSVRAY